MESNAIAFTLKNGDGIQFNFRSARITVKTTGINLEGDNILLEVTHSPNVLLELHDNPKAPEEWYVLDGEYCIR